MPHGKILLKERIGYRNVKMLCCAKINYKFSYL